jgi:predicted SnoaL-like aldol condensation-catalyzing enzyme
MADGFAGLHERDNEEVQLDQGGLYEPNPTCRVRINSGPTMNTKDPKLIALQFNECINAQNLNELSLLMTEDHAFIDREGKVNQSKKVMVQGWKEFFKTFPHYRNTFDRVQSKDNLVAILGHAFWSEKEPYDPVIWTATIVNGLVKEWRVYADTEVNRKQFDLL